MYDYMMIEALDACAVCRAEAIAEPMLPFCYVSTDPAMASAEIGQRLVDDIVENRAFIVEFREAL